MKFYSRPTPAGQAYASADQPYRYIKPGTVVDLLADVEFNMSHGHYAFAGIDSQGRPFDVHIAVPPYVHMNRRELASFDFDLYLIDGNGHYATRGPRVTIRGVPPYPGPYPAEDLYRVVRAQIETVGVHDCVTPECSGRAWARNPDGRDSRPNGEHTYIAECESCRLVGISRWYGKLQQQELKKEQRDDAAKKAQGYTHKTVAWVHPAQGGDDYEIVCHSKGPMANTQIERILREHGSCRFDDWRQSAL